MDNKFREELELYRPIEITDIGASNIEGEANYSNVIKKYPYRLIGFEPQPNEFQKLNNEKSNHEVYIPYALGDGESYPLYLCYSPGMSSILEPDPVQMDLYPHFREWGKVEDTLVLKTEILDEMDEVQKPDFIKIDVQGAELMVLNHGKNKLRHAHMVHCEVNFSPFYKNQPLFGDIDVFMRKQGFVLHTLWNINKRLVKPLMNQADPFAGFHHMLWADAVYIRPIALWNELPAEALLKMAILFHELYQSNDLALRALWLYDKKCGSEMAPSFLNELARNHE